MHQSDKADFTTISQILQDLVTSASFKLCTPLIFTTSDQHLFLCSFFIQSAKLAGTTCAISHTAISFGDELPNCHMEVTGSWFGHHCCDLIHSARIIRDTVAYILQHDGNTVRQATVDQGSGLPLILVHVTLNTDAILTLPDLSPHRTHTHTHTHTHGHAITHTKGKL